MKSVCALKLAALVAFAGTVSAEEKIYRLQLKPKEGEVFKEANYALWIPEGVKSVKAIIVHQHGCGDGAQTAGRTAIDDLHWRRLAEETGCAYLGTSLWPKDTCRDWCNPDGGSGRAFWMALAKLAEMSGHAEVVTVPWVVWGHSGGGFWTHRMLRRHPDRFAAVVMQSAGFGKPEEWPLKKLSDGLPTHVPMLIHVGGKEKGHERFNALFENGVTLFEELRDKGAPVALAIDPESGHDCGNCRYLTIPWIMAVLERGRKAAGVERETDGAKAVSWFPSEAVAEKWAEFVETGNVADVTKPHAPEGLEVEKGDEGFVLTWKAQPDLESGIKTFRIYRNGEVSGIYAAPTKDGKRMTEIFRQPNYSDTPSPPLAEMRFVDGEVEEGKRLRYEVTTVNWSGLESERSGVVEVGE